MDMDVACTVAVWQEHKESTPDISDIFDFILGLCWCFQAVLFIEFVAYLRCFKLTDHTALLQNQGKLIQVIIAHC